MPASDSSSASTRSRGPRVALLVWPLVGVAVVAAVALIWTWNAETTQRQDQVVKSVLIALLAGSAAGLWILAWLLFLSRLRWRTRLIGLALCVSVLLALGSSLKVRGVTGDVLPIVDWRWAADAGEALAELPSVPAAGAASVVEPDMRSTHDYPQFLGPERDGVVRGVRLSRDWPREVEPLWRQPIGAGWSGFAVSGDFAVTQEQRGDEEIVSCYDLRTGEPRWIHADATRWEDPLGGVGPRATPTIRDGRVYSLGATGLLNVLDQQTGDRIWSVDILKDNGAGAPTYGVSASPLVLDRAVVVMAGGPEGRSLVAYDRESGDRLWSGGDDRAAYGSPVVAELAGARQILVLSADNVVGHDAESGRVLWRYPWPPTEKVSQVLALPGERLFVSSGYGVGGKLLGLASGAEEGFEVELLWESRAMKAKFSNVVHRDGLLYGLDDGILACVDVESGQRRWKGGRYGHGQVILVGELLLVLSEKGTVALVEAQPQEFRELAAFPAIEGKTWNHPALAGRHLLVRNDREAACFELPLDPEPGEGTRAVAATP